MANLDTRTLEYGEQPPPQSSPEPHDLCRFHSVLGQRCRHLQVTLGSLAGRRAPLPSCWDGPLGPGTPG